MAVHRSAAAFIVLLALVSACDNADPLRQEAGLPALAPSATPGPFVGRALYVGTRLLPTTIGFTSMPTFSCPLVAPFLSSFSLLIEHRGGPDIFLDNVAFRFIDGSGRHSPNRFTRGDLNGIFGTTLISSATTRRFDFRQRFGCGFVSSPHSVAIGLSFLDRSGSSHQTSLTALIR
jgi:hypothetical protein